MLSLTPNASGFDMMTFRALRSGASRPMPYRDAWGRASLDNMIRRCALLASITALTVSCRSPSTAPSGQSGEAAPAVDAPRATPGTSDAAGHVVLALRCPAQVSKVARAKGREPFGYALELVNNGATTASIQEVQGFNRSLPGGVFETNAANASFSLVRVGAPKASQSYTCAEGQDVTPIMLQLAPGKSYSHPLPFDVSDLDPGEYQAEVVYKPLDLKSDCRFRVAP